MKVTKEIRQKILDYRAHGIKPPAIVIRIKKEFNVKLCIATIFNICKNRPSHFPAHKIVSAPSSKSQPPEIGMQTECLDELFKNVLTEICKLRDNYADKLKSIRLELIKSRVEARQNMKFQNLIDS